ncbi:valine--tRNA ligase, partial [bacterium]
LEDLTPEERAPVAEFEGLDRFAARTKMAERLEELGLLEKTEDHTVALSISDRSGEAIEPLLSEQWFLDQAKLAAPCIAAVENGDVRFVPGRYDRIFIEWMQGLHEWCLSRQLWWGHRIPVYYTEDGTPYAAASIEDAQAQAGDATIVRQDDDVLDTWFSSGLWPFATLGWPEKTTDLERYYPTSVLVTDKSIINLWVARMMMMGFDLVGAKPFSDVMIYATVLTEKGERMSKSKGNGIDPMDVIADVGADALRYVLFSQTGENQDLRFRRDKVLEGRNFATKIWNATRFALGSLEGVPAKPATIDPVDRWILGRLKATEAAVSAAYERYDMQGACQALYRFFWDEVCDWYLEIAKSRLNEESTRATPQWVLLTVVEAFLVMLHPVMPYVTEELHSYLPSDGERGLLLGASWPDLAWIAPDPEADAALA